MFNTILFGSIYVCIGAMEKNTEIVRWCRKLSTLNGYVLRFMNNEQSQVDYALYAIMKHWYNENVTTYVEVYDERE